MSALPAVYYDGRTSAAVAAEVEIADGALHLTLAAGRCSYPLADVHLQPPLGRLPRRIDLPDGGALEVADTAALAAALGERAGWLTRWEGNLRLAALAVPLLGLALWTGYRWGLPALADGVAPLVPPASERWMAEQTLALLDQRWLTPSTLPSARQRQIDAAFQRQARAADARYDYRLGFRAGGLLGANAFALPGGQLIVTDELVALARDDEEILAVLAHEMGHVEHRHGLRTILRTSGIGIAAALLAGDVASAGGALGTVPLALAELRYSRELESDADQVALDVLQRTGVSPCRFPAIMRRLTQSAKGAADVPDWLSTHPATEARLQRFDAVCRH